MNQREFGPMIESDIEAVSRLIHHAFAGPLEGAEKWIRESGFEHVRVVREAAGGSPRACLLRIPMGQYFGGRVVRMLGIAGVAVAPEARGTGLARWMMERALSEARADGFAISTLYASTPRLYRQVGYEHAGHRFAAKIPVERIRAGAGQGELRPLNVADEEQVRSCYARFAARFNGPLDRGEYVWKRTRELRETQFTGFGVFDQGALTGYVMVHQHRKPESGNHDLIASDVAFDSAAAGRRLLGFLAGFGTMADDVVLCGGPMHPLLTLLDERRYDVSKKDFWMVRVLDLPALVASRGWACDAAVQVKVDDPLIEANCGVWEVRVGPAGASAVRGSEVRDCPSFGIRGAAALLTGFASARQGAMVGWIEGQGGAAAAGLDALSASAAALGAPWMSDMF